MFRQLETRFLVAPQIGVADVEIAAAQGIRTIVNNRPDGEEAGAPQGEAIAAAAADASLAYVAIPVTHSGFSHAQIDALAAAIAAADGPVLAYCRSGTRSAHLWALTRARGGASSDELCAQAAAAGYDLSGLRPMLDALSAGAS